MNVERVIEQPTATVGGSWGEVDPTIMLPVPLGDPVIALEAAPTGMMDAWRRVVPFVPRLAGAVWGDVVVYRVKIIERRVVLECVEHVWVGAQAADDMRISTTNEVHTAVMMAHRRVDAW